MVRCSRGKSGSILLDRRRFKKKKCQGIKYHALQGGGNWWRHGKTAVNSKPPGRNQVGRKKEKASSETGGGGKTRAKRKREKKTYLGKRGAHPRKLEQSQLSADLIRVWCEREQALVKIAAKK